MFLASVSPFNFVAPLLNEFTFRKVDMTNLYLEVAGAGVTFQPFSSPSVLSMDIDEPGSLTFISSATLSVLSLTTDGPAYGPGVFEVGGLLFSKASDTDNVFANGIAAAISAADASTYLGFSDWRLPTYAETQQLVNAVGPAALISGGWSAGAGDWHWTSTLQGGPNYYVYAPGQTGGTPTGFSFGTGNYRIMLVRSL